MARPEPVEFTCGAPRPAGETRPERPLLAVLCWIAASAAGASGLDTVQAEPRMPFDIPSQGLESALQAHGAASGAQILYETSLTSGRRSATVKGVFTAEEALQLLLRETGLVPRRISRDAFTVAPAPAGGSAGPKPPPAAQEAGPPSTEAAQLDRFLGLAQARILEALCGSAEVRPGDYRLPLQLWFDAAGAVERVALLGSTGSARRDALLRDALVRIHLGEPLSAEVHQPVMVVILPRRPEETGDCAPFDGTAADPALLSPSPSPLPPRGERHRSADGG